MDWHVGCSGYHYKDWKGSFYPPLLPQRKWFEYYSTVFNTIELNNTFYRFPKLKFLQNWYDLSPPGFRFSVKAPRLITHFKQFNDSAELLQDFYGTIVSGLDEKLGAVLFQLPPKSLYDPDRLELIISCMDSRFLNVLEFRHESWWRVEVYEKLRAANIIFSGISHPALPDVPIINNSIVYYRFHGVPKLYYSPYPNETLRGIADLLSDKKEVKQAYVYFNNTATNAAIENAKWLNQFLGGQALLSPPTLNRGLLF